MKPGNDKLVVWLIFVPLITMSIPRLTILDIYVQGKTRTF